MSLRRWPTMNGRWSAIRFVHSTSVQSATSRVGLSRPFHLNNNNNNLSRRIKLFPITPLPFTSPVVDALTTQFWGICHIAHAIKGVQGDNNVAQDIKRIVEMARRASLRQEVVHTDFLTPPILKETNLILENLADIQTIAQGGYPEAERCRLSVGHPEALKTDPDIVAALSITGNFSFQPSSHGDFLGSILGTGISREKLGDIILQGDKGAHVLVVPELADFLTLSLDKVGNVSVSCKRIPLLALEYEPPRTKAFKSVEASLRVDAIASAGFKISRSKMAGLISFWRCSCQLDHYLEKQYHD